MDALKEIKFNKVQPRITVPIALAENPVENRLENANGRAPRRLRLIVNRPGSAAAAAAAAAGAPRLGGDEVTGIQNPPTETAPIPVIETSARPTAPLFSTADRYATVRALGQANTPIFKIMRINAGKQSKNAIRVLCDGGHDYNDAVDEKPIGEGAQRTYIETLREKYRTGGGPDEEWRGVVSRIFTDKYMARPDTIKATLERMNPFGADPDLKSLNDSLVEIRSRKDPLFGRIFQIPLESGVFGFTTDASTFNPVPYAVAAAAAAGQTLNWVYFPTQEMDAAARPGAAMACKAGAMPVNLTRSVLEEKFKIRVDGLDEYNEPPASAIRGRYGNVFTVHDYYEGSKHVFYEQGGKNVVEIWHNLAAGYTHMATLRVTGGVSVNALSQAVLGIIARGDAEEAGHPVEITFHQRMPDNGGNALIVKQILDWMQAYFVAMLWHYYRIKIVLITNDNFLLRIGKWLMVPWMIFMTKDGAQLYSFDNAAMELSDADKAKIRANIENVRAPATTATFLGELDGIIELFTPQLIAEPFIYLLKQEALRIKETITADLNILRTEVITDDILITKKFLLNMNFIDYAYSLYESGFTQKISDFALGASRISAAVSAYRDRKLATTPSEKLLGNIIALLKVYIPPPPLGGPPVNEQVGLWLTLLDFANDSNPRLQIIESIIADLVKNAVDVIPGSNPPQGKPATILDAFQKFSAITLSKSTGGIPCIPFSYFEASFEKVDCGNPSGGRINPFAQFGRYAGLMDGAVKLKAPKFICKKDSSIAITRKFKVVYEKYIADAYNRIRGYSAALAPQAGGAYIQTGGARNLVNKEWSGKTRYDGDSYGITEKFMYYKREQQSIQFVSSVTGAYRRPEEISAIKKMQKIIRAQYGTIMETRREYEDRFNAYRNARLDSPDDFAGNVIQFFEENPDNEYIAAEKMLIVASIDTHDTKVVARNNYINAVDSLFAPDADRLVHGRRVNAAAQTLFASDNDDAEGASTIDDYVNQLSEIASLLNREEYIATATAAAAAGESPAQASAGDFRYVEFLLYKYLKVYHDLHRGTSIDGEYDLFLQELSVLRSKCYMGILAPGYVWDRIVTLILDETIANPYSCVSHFLLNTEHTGLKEDMETIINLLYANCSVGLRRFIESVYNYYTAINVATRFPGWGLEKYNIDGEGFHPLQVDAVELPETTSARERRIRLENRRTAPPTVARVLQESAGVEESKESEEEEEEERELEEEPAMIIRATTPIQGYLNEEEEEEAAEDEREERERARAYEYAGGGRRGGVRHTLRQLGKKKGTRKTGASSKGRRTRRRK